MSACCSEADVLSVSSQCPLSAPRLKEIVATTISEAEEINPSATGIGVQPKFPCELASQEASRETVTGLLYTKNRSLAKAQTLK